MKYLITFLMHLFCITTVYCTEKPQIPQKDLLLITALHRPEFSISLDTKKHGAEEEQIARENAWVIENCLMRYPRQTLYDKRKIKGALPLYTACSFNHPTVVKYMVKRGLPPADTTEGKCVAESAFVAAQKGHHNVLTLLVPHLTSDEITQRHGDKDESIFSHTFNAGNSYAIWCMLQKKLPQSFLDGGIDWLSRALSVKENHAEYDKIAYFLILDCAEQRKHHYRDLNSLRHHFPITTKTLEGIRGTPFDERKPVLANIRSRINSYYK